jgi:hypothetical protein
MLASPGDVAKIRPRVEKAINDWNGLHSEERGVVLLPILWEKHATPQLGGRPQELINEELVRPSDILIAVFNARLGQDTGKAESGTVEEIGEFLSAGKPVLLYFSRAAIPRQGFDVAQYQRLEDYRGRVRQMGTYGEFSSPTDLEQQLARHLLNTMRRLRSFSGRSSPDASAAITSATPALDAVSAPTTAPFDQTVDTTIGPRRRQLLCDIVAAYLSTSADDRVPIDGRGGDGGSRLLHPAFSGRNMTVSIDDLRALHDARLVRMQSTGGPGDCELTPLRAGIDLCRPRTADDLPAAESVRRPFDASDTLPRARPVPVPVVRDGVPARDVAQTGGEQPAWLRSQKACLNLLGIGSQTQPDRYVELHPRVFNEGDHEAWEVRASVAAAGSEEWRPAGELREIPPKAERRLAFRIRTGPLQDPPVMERFEYRLRLEYRDGLSADNSIEYGIVFEGPGRDWRATVTRDNTRVDPLCPPQRS